LIVTPYHIFAFNSDTIASFKLVLQNQIFCIFAITSYITISSKIILKKI